MASETRNVSKVSKAKMKATAKPVKREAGPSWLEKQLVKLYLKSPNKVQFALAKYGVKHVVKKKKADLEEMLKH
ncbi:MAG TPA: hypothetical protein VNJ08_15005 [Bacteriovoracaceae bacterium]|nr:hypothetical protein [Bacteriovoracaceae bacterium]